MFAHVFSSATTLGMATSLASGAPQGVPPPPMIHVINPYSPEECQLPPVPKGVRLVAFGAYDGQAVSSAVIGNQDVETNLIDVTIEPGSEPLYLVLTSYESMIWRFSGATNRVTRVVVSSSEGVRLQPTRRRPTDPGKANVWVPSHMIIADQRPPNAPRPFSFSGVLGLGEKKVTIGRVGCPSYGYKTQGYEATRFSDSMVRHLGRVADFTYGDYSPASVSLPSGSITRSQPARWAPGAATNPPPPAGFDATMWREALRYWPRGLVRVNPKKVIAAAPVAPYLVLPSQMGLAQLVGSGALQVQRDRYATYRVVRPIPHMPPSMGGAHSVTLTFEPGIPIPPGDPVHSCIVEAGSGRKHGATCDKGEQ